MYKCMCVRVCVCVCVCVCVLVSYCLSASVVVAVAVVICFHCLLRNEWKNSFVSKWYMYKFISAVETIIQGKCLCACRKCKFIEQSPLLRTHIFPCYTLRIRNRYMSTYTDIIRRSYCMHRINKGSNRTISR